MIFQNASPKLLLFMAIALTVASVSFIYLYLFTEQYEPYFVLAFIGFAVLSWVRYFKAKRKESNKS